MKRITVIFLIILATASIALSQWKFHEQKYARMQAQSTADIQYLIQNDYHIQNVDGLTVYLYLNAEELSRLQGKGYDVKYIPNPAKEYADDLKARTWDTDDPMDDYHTFEELTAELQAIAAAHPAICNLISAGLSVQGRELWVMEISDNVDMEEDEPEFFYISSMHGDEVVGMEMCMYLINYLMDNYPENPQVRELVDETHIYIMPSMNPDGTAAHSRYNANGFDLNRQFPDRIDDPFNITTGRPQEVQVMMQFGQNHSPVLSANYHGGALVMNYPYDSNPNFQSVNTPTPDDGWFIDLSLTYSELNQPMYTGSFPQGITNGAAWYAIYGGMQDYCYTWEGRADVTIEVSNNAWPPASTLPGFWEDNREAMLAYMEMAHQGIRGLVSDVNTGLPIPAIITVDDNPHEVYPDPQVSDYYRLLLPGTYDIHCYCYGYEPVTAENVQVSAGQLTRVDMAMTPAEAGYSFDDLESGVGSYSHSAVTSGYSDQWHLSDQRSMSPTHSWKCGAAGTGNYANRSDGGLVTPVLIIQPNSILSFWQYMDSEVSSSYYPYAYDGGIVEIRMVNDTVWTQITPEGGYPYLIRNIGGSGPFSPETPVFAGHIEGREAFFNLSAYQGEAQFRFRFGSDGSIIREGWYIDDIELSSGGGAVVEVTLTPENPPIVIPAGGGTFNYTINIENVSGAAQQFDAWIVIQLPNGSFYGPVIQRTLNMPAGGMIQRTLTQNVPPNAPSGNYLYISRAGDYPTYWVEDSFPFEKE
ncbi:succinylglutamate desuccinylase/aspartoacylase family protein [bacterium]|nr:succinylglutamate desuccinylase/aspartoacylase family protein [bacterium]